MAGKNAKPHNQEIIQAVVKAKFGDSRDIDKELSAMAGFVEEFKSNFKDEGDHRMAVIMCLLESLIDTVNTSLMCDAEAAKITKKRRKS